MNSSEDMMSILRSAHDGAQAEEAKKSEKKGAPNEEVKRARGGAIEEISSEQFEIEFEVLREAAIECRKDWEKVSRVKNELNQKKDFLFRDLLGKKLEKLEDSGGTEKLEISGLGEYEKLLKENRDLVEEEVHCKEFIGQALVFASKYNFKVYALHDRDNLIGKFAGEFGPDTVLDIIEARLARFAKIKLGLEDDYLVKKQRKEDYQKYDREVQKAHRDRANREREEEIARKNEK